MDKISTLQLNSMIRIMLPQTIFRKRKTANLSNHWKLLTLTQRTKSRGHRVQFVCSINLHRDAALQTLFDIFLFTINLISIIILRDQSGPCGTVWVGFFHDITISPVHDTILFAIIDFFCGSIHAARTLILCPFMAKMTIEILNS